VNPMQEDISNQRRVFDKQFPAREDSAALGLTEEIASCLTSSLTGILAMLEQARDALYKTEHRIVHLEKRAQRFHKVRHAAWHGPVAGSGTVHITRHEGSASLKRCRGRGIQSMDRVLAVVSGDVPLPTGSMLLRIASLLTAALPGIAAHLQFPLSHVDRDGAEGGEESRAFRAAQKQAGGEASRKRRPSPRPWPLCPHQPVLLAGLLPTRCGRSPSTGGRRLQPTPAIARLGLT
jgi:hypothetical protein